MSHLICNFVFVFLRKKGTVVFCCSEISGQLDVIQDSSVVGRSRKLSAFLDWICVCVCVLMNLCAFLVMSMCAHVGTCVCVPAYMSTHIYDYVHLRMCVFSKTWVLSLQLLVLDNSRLH